MDVWDGKIFRDVGTNPTSMFDSKGGKQEDVAQDLKEKYDMDEGFKEGTTLDLKNKIEQKITFCFSTMHNWLEAIMKIILIRSMDTTIHKKDIEWICLFTLTKAGPTLDIKEAQKQSLEI